MLKQKKIVLVWLFISTVIFLACGDIADPLYEDDGIIISHSIFVKVGYKVIGQNFITGADVYGVTQENISEYRFGDTIAIMCTVSNRGYTGPQTPILFGNTVPQEPIIARVTSHKTGNVQHISFIPDPVFYYSWGWLYPPAYQPYIAYVSPVKYDYGSVKLIRDPDKKELKISPDGDILTAQIKYKNQIITTTITVQGD